MERECEMESFNLNGSKIFYTPEKTDKIEGKIATRVYDFRIEGKRPRGIRGLVHVLTGKMDPITQDYLKGRVEPALKKKELQEQRRIPGEIYLNSTQ